MSYSGKVNIPLINVAQKHQMVSHRGMLTTSQTEQVHKNCLEDQISMPHIMAESNFRAITNLRSCVSRGLPLASPDMLPKLHPIRPVNLIRTPPIPRATKFSVHYHLPQPLSHEHDTKALNKSKLRTPNPPKIREQTSKWNLNPSPILPPQKFPLKFLNVVGNTN
jgi:hypothetical protein